MTVRPVTLIPFTSELLPQVQPWFTDPEVRHRLGGPNWPERELRLLVSKPGGTFRGRQVLRTHSWVALADRGEPVAKVGGDVYDRWTSYDGSRPDDPRVTQTEAGPAMGIAYVVDPTRRRCGFGLATLHALVAHPDVCDVHVFVAGIDADNEASRRCARAAGFQPDTNEPDWEDTVYHFWHRSR